MLYWEDYIEMIEHLPQELKDRFTGIRELDLQVQNATDKLEEKVKDFFGGARKLRQTEREEVYDTMKKDYYKVLEDADEKVHQANQMYDLVERYIRRLDQDLYKFKMELEADNAGITEILEKRSLELDQTGSKDSKEKDLNPNSQKENRLLPQTPLGGIKIERRGRKRLMNGKVKGGESGTATPTTSYNGEPLDLAASHLVAALAHSIQKGSGNGVNGQGYEFYDHDSSLGMSLDMMDPLTVAELKRKKTDGFARFSMNGPDDVGANGIKKNKRKSQHIKTEESDADQNGQDLENGNGDQPEIWPYDPSEPRYCLCNQVSYGNMVACDNENCTVEWFHYDCVGISASPKGKWYCPQCLPTVKRRGRKTLNPQT